MNATEMWLPFPTKAPATVDAANLFRYPDCFFNDPAFAFDVVIPSPWRLSPMTESDGACRVLRKPAYPDAAIEIRGMRTDREVSPGDLLMSLLWQTAPRPIMKDRSDEYTAMGTISDVLYVDAGATRAFRCKCLKHGPRILLIRCSSPLNLYEQLAADFFFAADSLRFRVDRLECTAEPLRAVVLADGAIIFRCSVPATWQIGNSANRLEMTSMHDGQIVGRIIIEASRTKVYEDAQTSLRDAFECFRAYLTDSLQLHYGPAPIFRAQPHDGFDDAWAATYPVFEPNSYGIGEASLVCHAGTAGCYRGMLFSPARHPAHRWWEINKRAFELVNETFYIR